LQNKIRQIKNKITTTSGAVSFKSLINGKTIMASFFKEGNKLTFNGFKGTIIKITETYRKNVLVLKVTESPKKNPYTHGKVDTIGIFEYPDGTLEFMSVID
jgi:ribosomal protein L19